MLELAEVLRTPLTVALEQFLYSQQPHKAQALLLLKEPV
jgi:hypothetical protein